MNVEKYVCVASLGTHGVAHHVVIDVLYSYLLMYEPRMFRIPAHVLSMTKYYLIIIRWVKAAGEDREVCITA